MEKALEDPTRLAAGLFVEQQRWRDHVLTGLGWTAVAATTAAVAMVLMSGDRTVAPVFASCALLFLLVPFLRGRVSFRTRAWLLVGPMGIAAAVVMPALEGFAPNASLMLGAAAVFATVLLGRRSGFIVLALESAALLVVSVLHATGVIRVLPGYEVSAIFHPAAIARYVLLFAVASAALLSAVSYLLNRNERLLLDKARLLDEHRRTEEEARFVAGASKVLAASLDYEVTLGKVVRLALPQFADWCTVDIVEGGRLRRISGAHADPEKEHLIEELKTRPPVAGLKHPAAQALATRMPLIVGDVTDEFILTHAPNALHAGIVQDLGTRSMVAIPLIARDRPVGVITFNSAQPFYYGPTVSPVAEEIARRAAVAIDNARLYKAAQDSIRARDVFLSLTSHELRTPVTSLVLTAQHLRGPRLESAPESVRNGVAVFDRQVARLKTLIDDIMSVGQILLGRVENHPKLVDLAALVGDEVQRCAVAFETAKCSVTVHADEPVQGCWDSDMVRQVVQKLLANARKFGAGATIEIEVEGGEKARLAVIDHGVGIEPEALPHIFGRFERSASPSLFGGLGMGLYIVEHLVRALGGTIRAESKPHVETRFTVELPADPSGY